MKKVEVKLLVDRLFKVKNKSVLKKSGEVVEIQESNLGQYLQYNIAQKIEKKKK